MKGISPIIGMALVTAISIAAIVIVLNVGIPTTDRTKEIMVFDEIKNNMILIDSKITDVSLQGIGSSYRFNLIVNGGQFNLSSYSINALMETKYQIVGSNESYTENGITVSGELGKVTFTKSYTNIDIIGGGSFGKGSHNVNIKNDGYDSVSGKQIINISVS